MHIAYCFNTYYSSTKTAYVSHDPPAPDASLQFLQDLLINSVNLLYIEEYFPDIIICHQLPTLLGVLFHNIVEIFCYQLYLTDVAVCEGIRPD